MAHHPVLEGFSPAVREWFAAGFSSPTDPQVQGWPAIRSGAHTLVCAPTGSGKTLTAFLSSIDRLIDPAGPPIDPRARTRVLYVSPLRALAFDVEKNLRAPLVGIRHAADRVGAEVREVTVGMRTGDTTSRERQALQRRPVDLLITTPESLYLMLTSEVRHTLTHVDTVIIDEIHALAATKRGAHLMLSLERLERITSRPPQRIGLSATQRPLEEVAHFLGGHDASGARRPVTIVDAGIRKTLEVEVVVPVEDMGDLGRPTPPGELQSGPAHMALAGGRRSIWPSIYPQVLEKVLAHRSTIIFCNARRQAERLAARLNELAAENGIEGELVKAHHGSLAREQRVVIEDELKRGELRAIVATSSLELGIDMGAVDLVIQVESPGAVSRGLQRVGRAGHSVGEPSKGVIFPKHRGDLLEAAVVARRMDDGLVERTRFLRNPLDVLAQQIVAHVATVTGTSASTRSRTSSTEASDSPHAVAHTAECTVADVAALVRGAAGFAELSDDLLRAVLDLLSGRYPSDEFAELRPRLVWNRVDDTLRARDGAKRLAIVSGGTIPDRGLFGVFLPDGTRVGELDEEMVYESRVGETFLLGASTWRIEDITFERVVVSPAPGAPGKMPFWHGDRPGRPLEVGRALGAFQREARSLAEPSLMEQWSLDAFAARNVALYLAEQAEATGVVPDDRTIVIERFRDEIGDWRVCILSPFGTPVHAPWAMAIQRRLTERYDRAIEIMWTDDGIVLRLPDAVDELPIDDLVIDPDDIDELVTSCLPQTSLFAARFRECAARALLLPRRRPDQRTPLWQQRQRAAGLLEVAAKYPSFPMLLETTRECVQDVFDLPGLRELLGQLRQRTVRVVSVETPSASPFAQSLLFNWIAAYMYEGDAPLAERRAAALSLDRDLLRELLGSEELRELLDASALADLELELQHLAEGRRARSADELHDVLRRVGDLSLGEVSARCAPPTSPADENGSTDALLRQATVWLDDLVRARRVAQVTIAGESRYIAAEDAARYRDGLGCALPLGLPQAFTEPVDDPLGPLALLVGRYARTRGPFTEADVAQRFGVGRERVAESLERLQRAGRVSRGEFRPGGTGVEWCDDEVLRQIRRRSLAALRRDVEPVDQDVFARFLAEWHGIVPVATTVGAESASRGARTGSTSSTARAGRGGVDALVEVLTALQGAALPAGALEREILPSRLPGYRPSDLDALTTSGDVVWVGAGAVGHGDGRVRLFFADQFDLLRSAWEQPESPSGTLHDAVRSVLAARGASFWNALRGADPLATDPEVLAALWDLVWAGEVTSDSLSPLRAFVASRGVASAQGSPGAAGRRSSARPRPGRLTRLGPPAGAGRWSLVERSDPEAGAPSSGAGLTTPAAVTLASQLLERCGIVTREAVLADGVRGGFAAVYPVLKAMEERGQVRRGYFVSGLGAAQFALPGAVDRLRSPRDPREVASCVVVAATDPAQPYGAVLDWPETTGRPSRSSSSVVILRDGSPQVWFDRRAHHLVTFPAAVTDPSWAIALASLVGTGRSRSLEVRKVDGEPLVPASAVGTVLASAGFTDGYKGMTFRPR